jgi:hypothetical protein
MSKSETELTEKLNKAALLLGIASGAIRALYWECDGNSDYQNISLLINPLLEKLDKGIEDLFYK